MKNRKLYFFLASSFIVVIAGLGIIFLSSNRVSDSVKVATEEDTNQDILEEDLEPSDAWIEGLSIALREKGAVLYGQYNCGHCIDQKELFGQYADNLDYVECSPEGENANNDECTAKEITGTPTWIYQGEKLVGKQTLEKLAELIGYTGPAEADQTQESDQTDQAEAGDH